MIFLNEFKWFLCFVSKWFMKLVFLLIYVIKRLLESIKDIGVNFFLIWLFDWFRLIIIKENGCVNLVL